MISLGYNFVTVLSDFRIMSSYSQKVIDEMKNNEKDNVGSNSY